MEQGNAIFIEEGLNHAVLKQSHTMINVLQVDCLAFFDAEPSFFIYSQQHK